MSKHRTPFQIAAAVVTAALLFSTSVSASPISIEVETAEVMMETMNADLQGIAQVFGVDSTASLEFTTTTDPATRSFGYVLDTGVTYAGLPLSVVGGGAYNATTQVWEGQAVFGNGQGAPWITDWTYSIASADPYEFQMDWIASDQLRGWWGPDIHIAGGVGVAADGTIVSWAGGSLTWSGDVVASAAIADMFSSTAWSIDGQYQFADGSFLGTRLIGYPETARAVGYVVPEPATLTLLTFGGLMFARRRRQER